MTLCVYLKEIFQVWVKCPFPSLYLKMDTRWLNNFWCTPAQQKEKNMQLMLVQNYFNAIQLQLRASEVLVAASYLLLL